MNQKHIPGSPAAFFGGEVKASPTELPLNEIFRKEETPGADDREGHVNRVFTVGDNYYGGFSASDLSFHIGNGDLQKSLPGHGGLGESPLWSQSINQRQPCMSASMDLQSSICAGSPTSIVKPNGGNKQVKAATSGSSGEQSDDDDAEIETGSCEQSTDPADLKRIRRKASNRESARRSRKKRQAQQAELEWQVEKLSGENKSLYKELTQATQQLSDAATNNRVLKSDVEALRAKVKLAEELVTHHGSLSCSLNHLLQSQNLSSPQLLNTLNLPYMGNMSPTFAAHGDDNSVLAMAFNLHNLNTANGNVDAFIGNTSSDIYTWDNLSKVSN